ncbi:hypothetical protein J2808_002358 [Pseudarthrobacter sulfonivorans]|nr:hypothetical protein [Pseudarthrobacter sulfonivorans]
MASPSDCFAASSWKIRTRYFDIFVLPSWNSASSIHCIDAEDLAVARAVRPGPYSYDAHRKLRSTTTTRVPKEATPCQGFYLWYPEIPEREKQ